MSENRIRIFDCLIDNLTMQESLDRIAEFVDTKKAHQHVVVNVNKLIKAEKDEKIKDIINSCDLINVDGMPVVWVSKLLGKPLKERVAGVDLFTEILKISSQRKWRIYFLGAKEEIVSLVKDKALELYPGLEVAGYRNGYWSQSDEDKIVADIATSKADILFMAVPSPKKEIFLNKYLEEMHVSFLMGVGGTFDVFAGKIKRAPLWMQNCGLEWFYRFLKEPKKMFARYFVEGPYFFYMVIRELFKREKSC